MADNVTVHNGATGDGTAFTAVTDEVTSPYTGGSAQAQGVKILDGAANGTTPMGVDSSGRAAVKPTQDLVRLSVTPTIAAASAYVAGEAVGGIMTFANAAAVSGGAVTVVAVQVADLDQERAPMELVLFDRNPASGTLTDSNPADPTNTEVAQIVAVIPISGADYYNFSDNAVAHVACAEHCKLNGTDLFGVLVTRGTPTYTATTDIVVTVSVRQG